MLSARPCLKDAFWTIFIAHPSASEEETGGQESNFNLVVEDRRRGSGGTKNPKVPLRPTRSPQPTPDGGGRAPMAPPRLASRAGHWRVRKTRGVVGLNGSAWSCGAQAQRRGAAAGGRRCGATVWRPTGREARRAPSSDPRDLWGRRRGVACRLSAVPLPGDPPGEGPRPPASSPGGPCCSFASCAALPRLAGPREVSSEGSLWAPRGGR